jgi:cob(I)alamin adenosyltransferase
MKKNDENGWVIVYTGDGKGKTTAALGLTLRAAGHGNRVLMIQFLKSGWEYGELKGAERLSPEVTIKPMGIGCVGILDDDKPFEEHQQAAQKALAASREAVGRTDYDIVILDEVNIATHLKLIDVDDLLTLIKERSPQLTLVLTGRYADERIIEVADLVTEMKEIKHPFQKGIPSRKGIDH